LVASLSSNIQSASSLAFNTSLTRLSSVAIIFSSFLIMNNFYYIFNKNFLLIIKLLLKVGKIMFILLFKIRILFKIIQICSKNFKMVKI
jgi:hypothetical protein